MLLQNIFAKFGDGLSGKTRTISIPIPFYKSCLIKIKIYLLIEEYKHIFDEAR